MIDHSRKDPPVTGGAPDPAASADQDSEDDEIMAELRAAREAIWAEAGYDVDERVRRARIEQAKSGHRVVDFSVKPVVREK